MRRSWSCWLYESSLHCDREVAEHVGCLSLVLSPALKWFETSWLQLPLLCFARLFLECRYETQLADARDIQAPLKLPRTGSNDIKISMHLQDLALESAQDNQQAISAHVGGLSYAPTL